MGNLLYRAKTESKVLKRGRHHAVPTVNGVHAESLGRFNCYGKGIDRSKLGVFQLKPTNLLVSYGNPIYIGGHSIDHHPIYGGMPFTAAPAPTDSIATERESVG